MMDDIRVPIYLVTGFLESGKTTFLDFTLQQEYFAIDGKTLLILCEEGEEEYDMDKLKLTNTVVEVIEDEENPGYYVGRFFLRPHYQLEGMDIGMSLVSKLPGKN